MAALTWKTMGICTGGEAWACPPPRKPEECLVIHGPPTRMLLMCTLESAELAVSSSKTPGGTMRACTRCFWKTASRCGETSIDMLTWLVIRWSSVYCSTESALSSPRSSTWLGLGTRVRVGVEVGVRVGVGD